MSALYQQKRTIVYAPDSTCGVVDLVVRASELALLPLRADVGHIAEQPCLNTDLQERAQDRRNQLYYQEVSTREEDECCRSHP